MSVNTTAAAMANATFSGFEDTLPKKIIKVMMYCILLVVSFTGNLLIVWATSRDIRLRSTTNILIANMAVSDLLVPLFAIPRHIVYIIFDGPFWLIDGDFGLALCKITYFLPDVSWSVSIYSCVFIAVDRFYAVVHPFRGGLRRGKFKYIIPGIWLFSMAMFSFYIFTLILVKQGNSTLCIQDLTRIGITTNLHYRIYHCVIFSMYAGIPLPIISFLYLRIALKLRRTTVPGQAGNTSSARERQNRNALKMSALVLIGLYVSFSPFAVTTWLSVFGKIVSLSPGAVHDLFFSVIFIFHSSGCYNFFIYLLFTNIYRQNFKNLFSKCARVNPFSGRVRTNSLALENVAAVEQGEVNVDQCD